MGDAIWDFAREQISSGRRLIINASRDHWTVTTLEGEIPDDVIVQSGTGDGFRDALRKWKEAKPKAVVYQPGEGS